MVKSPKRYTSEALAKAVRDSFSLSQVMERMGIDRGGGSQYRTVRQAIKGLNLDTSHFIRGNQATIPRRYTDNQLAGAVQDSSSIAQVLVRIGLVPRGGNYRHVRRIIQALQLDTSHFNHPLGGEESIGPRRSYRNYSDEEFSAAVRESQSIVGVLRKIGLRPTGGNYQSVHQNIARLNLSADHFTGQLWSKGRVISHVRPVEDYLTNKAPISSHNLRLRLLAEGVFEHKCSGCDNTEWLGRAIPLELEHKDGNHRNNLLENLCLLCPNCHALTPTYRNKRRVIATI
jgi:TPP-dependent indolepyruvate ferredoxin oxidoreductase alpha subunit